MEHTADNLLKEIKTQQNLEARQLVKVRDGNDRGHGAEFSPHGRINLDMSGTSDGEFLQPYFEHLLLLNREKKSENNAANHEMKLLNHRLSEFK